MPDQHADHQHKRHGAKRGAQGNAGRRVGVQEDLDVVVGNFDLVAPFLETAALKAIVR